MSRKRKQYSSGQFFIRADGMYAPFPALDKRGIVQTRFVKIKTKGVSPSAIKKARLKRLHELKYSYDKHYRAWKKEQPQHPPQRNILLLISIGDYKHVSFDIIIKRVFAADDFKNLIERSSSVEVAHERIRNETIEMAAAKLRSNGHYGLASMLKHNTEIDYVAGGEYTWTDEQLAEVAFTRFDIRDDDRLAEVNSKRITPKEYDAKNQKKIEVDRHGNK